jgi:hypothetical protein
VSAILQLVGSAVIWVRMRKEDCRKASEVKAILNYLSEDIRREIDLEPIIHNGGASRADVFAAKPPCRSAGFASTKQCRPPLG